MSGSYCNPKRRLQFARTILISGALPLVESTEEDLETLQQFDNSYVKSLFYFYFKFCKHSSCYAICDLQIVTRRMMTQ